jgi:hypothetical protein
LLQMRLVLAPEDDELSVGGTELRLSLRERTLECQSSCGCSSSNSSTSSENSCSCAQSAQQGHKAKMLCMAANPLTLTVPSCTNSASSFCSPSPAASSTSSSSSSSLLSPASSSQLNVIS